MWSQSSRGPSGCDGAIFPKVVAPGQNVVSSDLSFGGLPLFATVSRHLVCRAARVRRDGLAGLGVPRRAAHELKNGRDRQRANRPGPGADNNNGYGVLDVEAAHALLANGNAGGAAPVITSPAPGAAVENQQYRYQVKASDPPMAARCVFALAAGPAGMAIDAATGLLSWIPAHAQLGANAVTVSVTDPTARVATQTWSILVAPVNSAPVAAADNYSAPPPAARWTWRRPACWRMTTTPKATS